MTDSQRSHHVRVDFAEGILESEGLSFRHRFWTVGEKCRENALAGRLELGSWDHFVDKADTPCFLGGGPFSRQRIAATLAGADGDRPQWADDGGREPPPNLWNGEPGVLGRNY